MMHFNLTDQIDGNTFIFKLSEDGDYSKPINVVLNGQMLIVNENYVVDDHDIYLILNTSTPQIGDLLWVQYTPL